MVVVIDSVSFVVLIKVGWLVVLLDLVVTTSFVVVIAICPGVCHVINVNVGLPKQNQHIQYKHNIIYIPVVGELVP